MGGEWAALSLGDVCLKIGSGATPRGGSGVYLERGPYALVRSQNVHNDGFRYDGLAFIDEKQADQLANVELHETDVLLNITGDSVARACQVDRHVLPARVNQHVAIIRPDPRRLDPRFLRYVLVSPRMQSRMLSWAGSGGTRNALTKAMIEALEVPAPDTREQRAIAHILGTLDDKIELNRRMAETLEAMARALFKSWFVDFDPVRAKAEGRETGLPEDVARLFPDSFEESEVGEVPAGWATEPLGHHVEVAKGLSYKGSGLSDAGRPLHNLNSIYEGGGYKHEGLKHYQGEFRERHVVRPGDLIVANTEQGHERLLIGYAAIIPGGSSGGLFSHHLYRVRPKSVSPVSPDFVCQLLNSKAMHDVVSGYANGTTVNMLPADGLESPVFVVPPAPLATRFTSIATLIRERQEGLLAEGDTLGALRDHLLPKLISGELRVPDAERVVGAVA